MRDIKTEGGTYRNTERVAEAFLTDGDSIVAGKTTFSVSIVGGETAEGPATGLPRGSWAGQPAVGTAAAVASSAATRPSQAQKPAAPNRRFIEEPCPSGLALFRSADESLGPVELVQRLAQKVQAYMVVDFTKLNRPFPGDLRSPDYYLFDWLPEEAQEAVSPLVLSPSETGHFYGLLAAEWGQDALVCFFSSLDKPAFLDYLRKVIRRKPTPSAGVECPEDAGEIEDGLLGLYLPSVAATVFANSTPEMVEELMEGVEAVLTECEKTASWQLLSSTGLAEKLGEVGFVRATEAAEQEAQT